MSKTPSFPKGELSLSLNNHKREEIQLSSPRRSYLNGSLTIINDLDPDAGRSTIIQTPRTILCHMNAEAESILDVLLSADSAESNNVQMCLGNLRNMQANLAHIIPQYVDNENLLSEMLFLKERIDETLDNFSPIPEDAREAIMLRSMSDIMNDLTAAKEDTENSENETVSMCIICFEERPIETLPCGHSFCKLCIQQHLQVSLTEGKALSLTCLALSCDYTFTESLCEQFLTEKQFNRYQQFLLAAAIRADPNKKCCISPDCNGILVRNQNLPEQEQWPDIKFTECQNCSVAYCFECVRSFHPGMTCKEFEQQLRVNQMLTDEEHMRQWQVTNNAKPCPRCKVLIVKGEGCNHVRCRTCGENFCWICMTKGATEGHFNMPGRCFGKLFMREDDGNLEKAITVAGFLLVMPILGPTFGISSAIEGIQLQSKIMNRHLDGVDFSIVVISTNKMDRVSLLKTYCSSTPKDANPIICHKKVTVKLVRCRLTLMEVNDLESVDKTLLATADGFIILFRPSIMSALDEAVVQYDDMSKMFERPNVPGLLCACVNRNARNKLTEIPKKLSKKRATSLGLLFRQIDVRRRWDVSSGFTMLIKAMLKRWEPIVDAVLGEE